MSKKRFSPLPLAPLPLNLTPFILSMSREEWICYWVALQTTSLEGRALLNRPLQLVKTSEGWVVGEWISMGKKTYFSTGLAGVIGLGSEASSMIRTLRGSDLGYYADDAERQYEAALLRKVA